MEPTEIVLYVPDCPYCARHREICEDAEQRLEYSLTDEELELLKLGVIETINERSNQKHQFEKLTNDN